MAGVPPLQTFYVYLTSGCNCACRHCYFVSAGVGHAHSTNSFLAVETLRKAIEQALPLGLDSLKWTGGEPTFHPEFHRFLRLQREFGLKANLETNGMLVDRRLADLLVECGIGRVSVSIDGATAETHDSIRGVRDGFARTSSGIRTLVAAGFQPEVIFTIQRENVEELESLVLLAAELGAGNVKLNILQPMLRGADLLADGGGLRIDEMILLHRRIGDPRNNWPIPVFFDIPMAFRPLQRLFDGGDGGVCGIRNVLGVLPGGEYALCGVGQHDPALTMGRVESTSLEELWQSDPLLARIRSGLPSALEGVCGECLMKEACLGCCVAANFKSTGQLFAPFWFCQAAADAGLFPLSRRRE